MPPTIFYFCRGPCGPKASGTPFLREICGGGGSRSGGGVEAFDTGLIPITVEKIAQKKREMFAKHVSMLRGLAPAWHWLCADLLVYN